MLAYDKCVAGLEEVVEVLVRTLREAHERSLLDLPHFLDDLLLQHLQFHDLNSQQPYAEKGQRGRLQGMCNNVNMCDDCGRARSKPTTYLLLHFLEVINHFRGRGVVLLLGLHLCVRW